MRVDAETSLLQSSSLLKEQIRKEYAVTPGGVGMKLRCTLLAGEFVGGDYDEHPYKLPRWLLTTSHPVTLPEINAMA